MSEKETQVTTKKSLKHGRPLFEKYLKIRISKLILKNILKVKKVFFKYKHFIYNM